VHAVEAHVGGVIGRAPCRHASLLAALPRVRVAPCSVPAVRAWLEGLSSGVSPTAAARATKPLQAGAARGCAHASVGALCGTVVRVAARPSWLDGGRAGWRRLMSSTPR
jgi:hypothetical protein